MMSCERQINATTPLELRQSPRFAGSGRVQPGCPLRRRLGLETPRHEVGGDRVEACGTQPPLEDSRAPRRRCCRAAPRRASPRRPPGGSGRAGAPPRARAPRSACRSREDGAIRPKKMPWMAAAIGPGRWSRVSSSDPGPERYDAPRHRPAWPARTPVTDNGRNRERNSSGANARIPASSALSSTGISAIRPRTRSGASDGDLEGDVGPQRGAADDGLLGAELVEQRDHLLAEGGHRVHQRVVGAVRAPVPEQVDGHDVRPGRRPDGAPAAGASGAASAGRG